MPRSTHKVASHRRRRKFIKLAKGYWGARSKVWTIAKNHIEKGLQYAYRDRRNKKRTFRRLWIVRGISRFGSKSAIHFQAHRALGNWIIFVISVCSRRS